MKKGRNGRRSDGRPAEEARVKKQRKRGGGQGLVVEIA